MQSTIEIESMSLIDNNNINQENPGGESAESLTLMDKDCFRKIQFHVARKPFTVFSSGGDDKGFRIETINPETSGSKSMFGDQVRVGSGKKRDASEMENGLDQELSFGITFKKIGAGLENLGNTCFLNSVLQCLTYTEPLAAYLQSGKHQVTCRKSGFCALCAIQKHVNRALQLSGRSLAPKDLVSNLHCISRTFRNSRQEDAHEYMVNLLESMHKCCLPNGVPIESQSAYDKSLVHRIFGGQLRSQVKCMQCNYCSNKFDPFMDLSLEILNADTLYKAFANFTVKEQLDGGAKQYQCEQCKQKVKALKQLTIYKAPNVLTVHLKRFGCHMSGQKIDKKVHFGPTLDLKPFVTGPYDGDLKYTLYGVLVHAGWSTHSGHYYCFVRTSSGMWYSLDDNRVFQVSEKKVYEQKAYMLFYFRDRKNFPSKRTKNRPGTPRETQMNIDISNGNGSSDVHMSLATIAPKETQTNTILSNGSLNGDKSLVSVSTVNQSGAPKDPDMKTGLNEGSSNAQESLAAVVIEGNGSAPVAPKETQTNSIIINGSLSGQKSSAVPRTMTEGSSTGALEPEPEPEPEHSQMKGTSVPESISEPSRTENHKKEIGADESSGGGAGYTEAAAALPEKGSSTEKKDCGGKAHNTELADLPKMESCMGKPRKKVKNFLKGKLITMKFSSNALLMMPLNQRKRKKHKRNKLVKNLAQENLVNEHSSSLVKSEARETIKPVVDNVSKERVGKDCSVLATNDSNSGSKFNPKDLNQLEVSRRTLSQKDLVHMLTRGIDDTIVPRWDEDEPSPSQFFTERRHDFAIGHIGDEWDAEYDSGKRKKARITKTEFDGKNTFQDIANEWLNLHSEKQNLSKLPQNLSKMPPMTTEGKYQHLNKSQHFKMSRAYRR